MMSSWRKNTGYGMLTMPQWLLGPLPSEWHEVGVVIWIQHIACWASFGGWGRDSEETIILVPSFAPRAIPVRLQWHGFKVEELC